MKPTRAILVAVLLLGGCGSCQGPSEAPQGAGGGAAPAQPGAHAPAEAGKIQVAPVQPSPVARKENQAVPQAPAQQGAAAMPQAGAGAAQQGQNVDEDCFVVADADPDYGAPPLSVSFSAEAECSAGKPTYKWDFGDGSQPSTEANPSHTYAKVGDFVASVTITGPNGATSTDEIDITVEEE